MTLVEHLGELSYLYVDIPKEGELVLKIDGDNQYKSGDTVYFGIRPNSVYLFNDKGTALPRLASHIEAKKHPFHEPHR